MRHPSSWKSQETREAFSWYRHFLGPKDSDGKPGVTVTVLAGALPGTLGDYAQTYVAGSTVTASGEETRSGVKGRSWEFASEDGLTRHSLLLVGEEGRVVGLHAQGPTRLFDSQRKALEEMARSLTLERPATYPVVRDDGFGFVLRMPPSWRESRRFSGRGTLLLQYTSPPLAAEKGGETVHASLTLTVEPLPPDGDLDSYYDDTRVKLGEAFKVVSHGPWQDGYVDVMTTETPISASRVKRFFVVGGGRGFGLAFEARDDVFGRVARWCDLIASTFAVQGAR